MRFSPRKLKDLSLTELLTVYAAVELGIALMRTGLRAAGVPV